MNVFQRPMHPWSGLARWSRQVELPKSGINLHLYDTGEDSKTPVLLLHGLGDEADTWRHVIPLISADYRAIAPDLPGFGLSEKPERSYTIPFFADTMLELLDFLAVSRVILVGHSTGAVIAQKLAVEHPERVEKLVLIGGSLVARVNKINPSLLFFLTPVLGEWFYNRLRKNPQAAYNTLEPYYNRLEDLPQADRDFLYQRVNERVWSDGQRRAFLSTFRNLARWITAQQKSLPDLLSGSTVPTTLIWGKNDRINSVENAQALIDIQPSARSVVVPGAGHNLHQEKPDVVVEAIGAL